MDVEDDDDNSMVNVYLNKGGMDGTDGKELASYEHASLAYCPSMAIDQANLSIYMTLIEPSGVYRIDIYDLNENNYRSAYFVNKSMAS